MPEVARALATEAVVDLKTKGKALCDWIGWSRPDVKDPGSGRFGPVLSPHCADRIGTAVKAEGRVPGQGGRAEERPAEVGKPLTWA